MSKILIVDDERSMRDLLLIMLKREGYDVTVAETGEEALAALKREIFDLVITDIKMPRITGLDILKAVKEVSPDTLVIMITAFASAETAVEAMKIGAYDYITKPFKVDEIKLVIKNAIEKKLLKDENRRLKQEIAIRHGYEGFVGGSEVMKKVFALIAKVADSKSTVFITGESGTGKELVARAIHHNGVRKERPFVTVNCGALPEALLESELFGHMKGSFTGAIDNKAGLFEVADGGSIFLDEIGDMPLPLQVKLLRVLQEREFKRVGGTADIKVDVRVIAATNRDLKGQVAKGEFREDLYYRLNVIPIALPSLRERREDIPALVEHFLAKYSAGGERKRIAPDALQRLMDCEWKGNVRELENVIERAVALSDGPLIKTDYLPEPAPSERGAVVAAVDVSAERPVDLEKIVEDLEVEFLTKALDKAHGVKTDAAKLLGLSFRSFRHRLKKYEIGNSRDDKEELG
ncbi:MAG: sigma-54 dependent transcriptional regulator [Nitrospirota bacterium]|nr:sigma-54 dependent transcriptional regulator [Nitrospirota bacterium]